MVFRSRFFWNLYLTYALVVLATTAVIGFLIDHRIQKNLSSDIERSLKEKVELLASLGERALASPVGALQDQVVQLGRHSRTRVTIIRADGRVLADSDEDPAAMEDHSEREEVRQALEGSHGVSRRLSATLGVRLVYVARAVGEGEDVKGFVRVAVPLRDVENRLGALRGIVVAGAAFGILFALVLGLFVARKITAPVTEMTEVAEAIRQGQYDRRMSRPAGTEMGVLAETIDRVCSELTERITTMSRERAQFQAILAGMVEGVLAVDQECRVLFCNQAACDFLGARGPASVIGNVLEAPEIDVPALLSEVRSRGEPMQKEVTLRPGGREVLLELHATPFRGGGIEGTVIVLLDISELRRLESIRRDFVANVSHELKTPLTSIKGYVETLLDGALHDEENNLRFLRKIESHVDQLAHLVVDLLNLARIESQKEPLPRVPVSWGAIVENALRHHEATIQDKELTCSTERPPQPVVVLGDADGMSQILENLLDNAIKYTPPGGRIDIRVFARNGRGVLEVEDSGIGIPAADLEHVFERFYRVDKARSRYLGGTGLGLSIVKHLASSLSGDVSVESEIGKGTRFTVSIPMA